jgi:hypothetical protein
VSLADVVLALVTAEVERHRADLNQDPTIKGIRVGVRWNPQGARVRPAKVTRRARPGSGPACMTPSST